jgi:hypothetical protein
LTSHSPSSTLGAGNVLRERAQTNEFFIQGPKNWCTTSACWTERYVRTYTRTYVRSHVRTYTRVRMHVCAHVPSYSRMHVCPFVHMCGLNCEWTKLCTFRRNDACTCLRTFLTLYIPAQARPYARMYQRQGGRTYARMCSRPNVRGPLICCGKGAVENTRATQGRPPL